MFAFAQEPSLNFRRCNLLRMASNPRIPQVLNLAKIKVHTVSRYVVSWLISEYSQTWLESHCLQHQPLHNNTHGRNGFNGLCTKCPGYNNNLVISAHFTGTKGVVVNKFDCNILIDMLTAS